MANECLVTKLKSEVANSNLTKLGYLRVTVNNVSNSRLYIQYSDNTYLTSGKIITSEGVTVDLTTPSNPRVTGTGTIDIKDKYLIKVYGCYSNTSMGINIEDLQYSVLENFSLMNLEQGGLTKLSQLNVLPSSLKVLNVNIEGNSTTYHTLTGNITDVGEHFTNVTTIDFTHNEDITGTMQEFATVFPKLTNMTVLANYGFTGDVIDFVKVRRSQNVNTGSVSVTNGHHSGIKFNGNSLASGIKAFSWTPNSSDNTKTDITYDGTTITIDSNGNVVG